jgi:hypothetical protein
MSVDGHDWRPPRIRPDRLPVHHTRHRGPARPRRRRRQQTSDPGGPDVFRSAWRCYWRLPPAGQQGRRGAEWRRDVRAALGRSPFGTAIHHAAVVLRATQPDGGDPRRKGSSTPSRRMGRTAAERFLALSIAGATSPLYVTTAAIATATRSRAGFNSPSHHIARPSRGMWWSRRVHAPAREASSRHHQRRPPAHSSHLLENRTLDLWLQEQFPRMLADVGHNT